MASAELPHDPLEDLQRTAEQSLEATDRKRERFTPLDDDDQIEVERGDDNAELKQEIARLKETVGVLFKKVTAETIKGGGGVPFPLIFISHRHSDKRIADVINKHLRSWNVRGGQIYQSSSPQQGTRPGTVLSEDLKKKLAQAHLLILVYTFPDEDWSYCMWECGVATDPETEHTRIIVLQCTESVPTVYQDHLRVTVNKEGIHDFVGRFHRDNEFFPVPKDSDAAPAAFFAEIGDDILSDRISSLHDELLKVIPTGKYEEIHRSDFIQLIISPVDVRNIRLSREYSESEYIIENNIDVGEKTRPAALRHFNYHSFQSGLKLSGLIERWSKKMKDLDKDQAQAQEWISDLYKQIFTAIRNETSNTIKTYFRSVRDDTRWWFCPIITFGKKFPDDHIELDLYLHRVPDPTDLAKSIERQQN
jgi:hypothetical protein